MQTTSPWESDFRSGLDYDSIRAERSTSAPPPDTNLFLGTNESMLGTYSYLGGKDKLNPLFENRNGGEIPATSLFLDSGTTNGHSTSRVSESLNQPLSGLSSDFRGADFSIVDSQLGTSKMIGESLIRSQSAAPSLDGRLAVGPPPGLENSETPVVSNLASSRDSYLESDRSRLQQLGQRRSASTGVIGGSSPSPALHALGLGSYDDSTSGAVRPAAKTLMDLIQEDFPPESSPDVTYQNDFPRGDVYFDRPRTASPLSSRNQDQFYTTQKDFMGRNGGDDLTESLDRFHISQRQTYGSMEPTARERPQYPTVEKRGSPPSENKAYVQGSIYAPVAAHPQQQRIQSHNIVYNQQQPQYDQRPAYGTQPPQVHNHVQTQVLPSGHTVYVNAPPTNPYGYATVQYHPPTQQHHLVHQTMLGGMAPHGDQYISVVPIQGGGGGPIQAVSPGGAYAFWQPDGQQGAQTLTIVNAHGPQGVPITVTQVGKTNNESPRQHQGGPSHGGRVKEKGGKSRRGSGRTKTHQSTQIHSSLLEEFKSKKHRDWTIYQIKGHVVEFCQDQNGSRFIQQRLEVGDITEKESVMTEALPAIGILRNDVFGNYVVQKLLEFGTPKMRLDLQETLQGEILQLSLQMYGCRVVQKALETMDESNFPKLLKEFHNNVLSCIHDQNGNHVIQKCIEVVSEKAKKALVDGDEAKAKFLRDQIDFIVDDALRNVASLSCHPYGCRVLQRILEYCIEPERSRALDEIKKCHKTLLDDQYGNYVIQHVLQFGRSPDRDSILEIVVENGLLLLSRQKFASNVVEKLLKYGSDDQRKRVVREMLRTADDHTGAIIDDGLGGSSVVLLMVRDAYANYVVQTTLDVISECEEKALLLKELNSHAIELKNYTFAKHIVTKLGA